MSFQFYTCIKIYISFHRFLIDKSTFKCFADEISEPVPVV